MPKQFVRSLLLVSVIIASATPTYSAIYIDKVDFPKKVAILKIEGKIKYEDDLEFKKALRELKMNEYKIKLNSVVLS